MKGNSSGFVGSGTVGVLVQTRHSQRDIFRQWLIRRQSPGRQPRRDSHFRSQTFLTPSRNRQPPKLQLQDVFTIQKPRPLLPGRGTTSYLRRSHICLAFPEFPDPIEFGPQTPEPCDPGQNWAALHRITSSATTAIQASRDRIATTKSSEDPPQIHPMKPDTGNSLLLSNQETLIRLNKVARPPTRLTRPISQDPRFSTPCTIINPNAWGS